MDINSLAQGGAGAAFVGLALYLIKVVVNDMKHDISATRVASEQQTALLLKIVALLERQNQLDRIGIGDSAYER